MNECGCGIDSLYGGVYSDGMDTPADYTLTKLAPHKYAVVVDGERVGHIARSSWDWAGFINGHLVTEGHERRDWAAFAVAAKANALVHKFSGENYDATCRTCGFDLNIGKHLWWDRQRKGKPNA